LSLFFMLWKLYQGRRIMVELIKKGTLGSILSASRIITESDVQAALEEQARTGCRLGEALIKLGVVSQEDVDWALSNQLDIPYIRLKQDLIDREAICLVPADMARRFTCIPLFLAGEELIVAIADPLDRNAIETIERQTGLRVSISVAVSDEIRAMIDECYGPDRHENLGFESPSFSGTALELINADLSGAKLLECLLITILKNQLVSLSLQPLGARVIIRGRRLAASHEIGTLLPGYYADFVRNLRARATDLPVGESASSACFGFEYRGKRMEFQVAIMQAPGGDYITLRQRIPERIVKRLSDLNLAQEQHDAFLQLARDERGVTFFASPASRERNRSMELMLEEASTQGKTVLILGDGADWSGNRFPQVPFPAGATERAKLIRASLDHDPDVLVIEELGEGPALAAACRAAMGGVRVLAGLDVRGIRDALLYLLRCQQAPSLLLPINGLVSIKGVRCLCPECRTECTPTLQELAVMGLEQFSGCFFRSSGCDACGDSGFRERRILMDVALFDDELRQAFLANSALLERRLAGSGNGSVREGLAMVCSGELSPEEYIAAVIT
jgi:hypothetical protein